VNVLQLLNLSIPLGVVGQAGGSVQAAAGSIIITVLGQGWTTGTAAVGAITTTTPGTNVVHTVTQMGSDSRTASHGGQLTLVSGFQAITNVAGTLPGFATQILRFAGGAATPEPGTLLLLGTGVAGLALLGRRRMR
jgi:PEP-CTERM motif